MYKIETLYTTLEQLVKDIDSNIVVKFKIMDPESSPAVLFSLPHITDAVINQLSDPNFKTVSFDMKILVKGHDTLTITRIYEDFRLAFMNELSDMLSINGLKVDVLFMDDFSPEAEIFGTINYEVLSGKLRFNIEL